MELELSIKSRVLGKTLEFFAPPVGGPIRYEYFKPSRPGVITVGYLSHDEEVIMISGDKIEFEKTCRRWLRGHIKSLSKAGDL